MRKIAQETNVSTNTLYGIYGSKETLVLYTVSEIFSFLSEQEVVHEAGLERFLSRLTSIAQAFEDYPDLTKAMTTLLFQGSSNTALNEVLLDRAVTARSISLREMVEMKQLDKDFDIDFHARALVSLLWGTALFWIRGQLDTKDIRSELVRTGMHQILAGTTRKARARTLEIIEEYSIKT